jgi:lipopolysaccharide export LptBFGC system permease protein LptF
LVRADIAYWDPDAIHPVTGRRGVWWLGANSLDSANYRIYTPDDWTEEIEAIEEGDTLDIEETPDDFGVFERKPIEMSYRELNARIKKIALEGYSGEDLLPDLEFKRAVPFSVVALMVIGMASGASTFLLGREGAARFTYPLGICLVILGCFYAMTFVCLGLGKMGHLAPSVSAWFPIVFFGCVGLFMLYRER